MTITDSDRLDFLERYDWRISWYPYQSSAFYGIRKRVYFLYTNSIREAIDAAIMTMREREK